MSPPLVILAAAFGAAVATFLQRPAHRLAVGFAEPPRSACARCARPFPPGLAGWVRAGAACRCRNVPFWAVLAGAALCGSTAAATGPSAVLPIYLLAVAPGLLLALVDLRCLRLPDPLVAALAFTAAVPLAVLHPAHLARAVAAAVTLLTAYGILAVVSHGGLGLGDVKLAAVLGLILGFAGWPAVLLGVLAAHLLAALAALILLVSGRIGRRQALPFGPALLLGALIAAAAAGP